MTVGTSIRAITVPTTSSVPEADGTSVSIGWAPKLARILTHELTHRSSVASHSWWDRSPAASWASRPATVDSSDARRSGSPARGLAGSPGSLHRRRGGVSHGHDDGIEVDRLEVRARPHGHDQGGRVPGPEPGQIGLDRPSAPGHGRAGRAPSPRRPSARCRPRWSPPCARSPRTATASAGRAVPHAPPADGDRAGPDHVRRAAARRCSPSGRAGPDGSDASRAAVASGAPSPLMLFPPSPMRPKPAPALHGEAAGRVAPAGGGGPGEVVMVTARSSNIRLDRSGTPQPLLREPGHPSGSSSQVDRPVTATDSSSWRSCETSRTVPPNPPSADSSCSMAGRSRWLVGSSSTRKLTPVPWNTASSARVRSPGESEAGGRVTCSAPSPNLASRDLASACCRPQRSITVTHEVMVAPDGPTVLGQLPHHDARAPSTGRRRPGG
jgi:hypothetical protein